MNIIEEGNGATCNKGDTVYARYSGKLTNGREFDSSGSDPLSFKVGAGRVIRAWDEAFVGLKVGCKARIIAPPEYAYGDRDVGNGLIPANSTLIFDIEVVGVNDYIPDAKPEPEVSSPAEKSHDDNRPSNFES